MTSTQVLARTNNFRDLHRVTVSGRGDTTLVLGNGFGTDQTIWQRILPWLEQRYRVVRFDWLIDPYHYDASRYATLDGFADDLLAVLIATDTRRCLYVGHSMATMVGMLAAKREPEWFLHLVMLAPSPCFVNHPDYGGGFSQAEIDQLLHELGRDYVQWIEEFSPRAVAAPPDCPETEEFANSLRAMRPDVAFSMALTVFHMDLRNRLDGFAHPVTIAQTRDDIAVPLAVAHYLQRQWPQATLEVIDAAGHFPHLTAPAQLIDILNRHLPAN